MPRTRLLARLFASEPRLVRLHAPPGYGKSTLARLFARRFDRHAICDCSGLRDSVDFAGRALASLAAETQGGADSISAARLRLHATQADAAAWSRALLEEWKARQEHSLFIIEHAEAIARDGEALALIGDLLATRPPERVILISSRIELPLRFAHYLAPHQNLALARGELRFDRGEAAAVFEGTGLAPEIVGRIVDLANGWPIVLLLLARFAQYDANIERFIERLEDVEHASLHEYLAGEVLAAFTPEMMSAILATAAIPNATLEDIAAATGIAHATPIVDRLMHLPGFISSESGAYRMHPLLRAAIRGRTQDDPAGYLLRAAREYDRSGDFLRAAELYAASGDEPAAAAALDRLPAIELQAPSARTIDALAKIAMPTVCSHPNLWVATLAYRRQTVEAERLYEEAQRLLRAIEPGAATALQRRLRLRLAMLAQGLEKLAEARALLEACGDPAAWSDEPEERRLALVTSALVAAKQGHFAESDALLDACDAVQGARHLRFDTERRQIAIEKARLLGDWHGALKTSEEALYAAQRSGATPRIIDAARAVSWAAWYGNDDARCSAANEMLEDCGDAEARAFAGFVAAALAHESIETPAHLLPVARWQAALATADAAWAKELFDRAIDEIDAVENAFLRVAIRVCAALLLPTQRRRLLEARVIAQPIESPPLQASLELLIDSPEPSDYGIFAHLAARVARSPLKFRKPVLHLDVVASRVRRGSDVLPVSDRGFELLSALALLPEGTTREELAGAIWPGLDTEAGLNTLKMCVSRTRAQLGDKEAIRSTKRGYALSDAVEIDVRAIERLLRDVRGGDAIAGHVRRKLEETIGLLDARERGQTRGWAWFGTHAARLDELQRELALVLAKDAFKRGDPGIPADTRAIT
jgi:DNA-binding winged helix-turn-helix (wHTH) protein